MTKHKHYDCIIIQKYSNGLTLLTQIRLNAWNIVSNPKKRKKTTKVLIKSICYREIQTTGNAYRTRPRKPAKVLVKSHCWRHKEGYLSWVGVEYKSFGPDWKRFPAGDIIDKMKVEE